MIHALGVTTDVRTAASILGLSGTAAYKLIQRDGFPVPVIRAGGIYRIPVAAILALLHLPPLPHQSPPESTPDPEPGEGSSDGPRDRHADTAPVDELPPAS
jgi:hypothetical protein